MNKKKIAFWVSTSIISAMMVMSAIQYFTNPEVKEGFIKMGFNSVFRIELGVAKILAALALIIPMVPARIKEWAYAGLGIVFVSAGIAHLAILGEGIKGIIAPTVFMGILILSYMTRPEDKKIVA